MKFRIGIMLAALLSPVVHAQALANLRPALVLSDAYGIAVQTAGNTSDRILSAEQMCYVGSARPALKILKEVIDAYKAAPGRRVLVHRADIDGATLMADLTVTSPGLGQARASNDLKLRLSPSPTL